MAFKITPGQMADRARRHQRALRLDVGATALALRLVEDGWLTVKDGPCAGLRYPAATVPSVDCAAARGIGSYESELAEIFEEQLGTGSAVFVDIGCADGYYAVGLTRRNPQLKTLAYDISRSARELCGEIAEVNGCADRVTISSRFTPETEVADGAFVLCDIEGAEATLINDRLARRLRRSRVLVEVHSFAAQHAQQSLEHVLGHTHTVRIVEQQPRNPMRWPIPGFTEEEWRVATSEWRPPRLHWAYFEPRS